MKRIKILTLAAFAFAATATTAVAQTAGFLNQADDARSMAMGGAVMGLEGDAGTISVNPASMMMNDYMFSANIGYQALKPTTALNNQVNLAGFLKFSDNFGMSIFGKYVQMPTYDLMDKNGNLLSQFTPSELAAGLGFAYRIGENFSIGLNAKFIRSAISDAEYIDIYQDGTAFAGDLSLMYRLNNLRIAAGITNIGTKITYIIDGEGYQLPTAGRVGVGYGAQFSNFTLDASAEVNYYLASSTVGAGLGLELGYANTGFLRAGFHYASNEGTIPTYASVGLGGKFGKHNLGLAYLLPLGTEALKNTLMISYGFNF